MEASHISQQQSTAAAAASADKQPDGLLRLPAVPYSPAEMQSMPAPPEDPGHSNNTVQAFKPVQLKPVVSPENTSLTRFQPAQLKKNDTGLPDQLKTGIESMSSVDISDVKVHYNSPKPATLQAHAYAQGTDIHVASGQEKHLPHEAWHVVQQKQGRVNPTKNVNGQSVNDNEGLEQEADKMGSLAIQRMEQQKGSAESNASEINTLQLHKELHGVARQVDGRGGYTLQLAGDGSAGFLTDGEQQDGKMKKSAFLASLRAKATAVADEELKSIGQSASNCPFIGYWISFYSSKPAVDVEKAIHLYSSETQGVSDAGEVISLVTATIRTKLKTQLAKSALEPVDPAEPSVLKDESGEVNELMPAQLKQGDVAQLGCNVATAVAEPKKIKKFSVTDYEFSSLNKGKFVGSVYFTTGRLRLEHTAGPAVEPAEKVDRFLIAVDAPVLRRYGGWFKQVGDGTMSVDQVYDQMKGSLQPFTIGNGGKIMEFTGSKGAYTSMHLSGGTPVKHAFTQEHIDILFAGASTKDNVTLRRMMDGDAYLQSVLTSASR